MMAHKRPRDGDEDHRGYNDGIGNDDGGASGNRLLSLFGRDAIHEIETGKTTFARGGFGELSIALKSRCHGAISSSSRNSRNNLYSFVAVKTIHNAITNNGRVGINNQHQSKKQQQLSSEVLNELLALRLLQPHPNIVPLVAVYPAESHGALSLAFDYSPIDLREVLEVRRRTFRQPLAFSFLRTIFRDVFEALAHCHDNGILHRDLKPGNLLVSSKGVIRLCDFGLAMPFTSEECQKLLVEEGNENMNSHSAVNNDKGLCTLFYRPPEVLLGGLSEYPSVDSWSAGVVSVELITGWPLWPGRNVIDQLSLIFRSLGTPNEKTWPSVRKLPDYGKLNFGSKPPKRWETTLARAAESPMLVDFVSKLLVLNPAGRLTAREALDHDWLRVPTSEEGPAVGANERHRKLRDELLVPTSLRIPPLLFPENRELVGKLGLGIAELRRSVLGHGTCWKGPNLALLKLSD